MQDITHRLKPARMTLLVGMMGVSVAYGAADAAVLLSTDFTGRSVSGLTASNISWTTLGVQDPGDLTVMPTIPGLFDTANAQGHFAPDRNVGNEGPWNVNVPLVLDAGTATLTIESLDLDWQHFNNSGIFQGVSRSVDWTATLFDSSLNSLGTVTAVNVAGTSGLETLTFTSPVVLPAGDTYVLNIDAAGSDGNGNNTGLDGFVLNGTATPVPEPSATLLWSLSLLALLRRRRGRH